jgi:alpha-N-arabinofuranosidase
MESDGPEKNLQKFIRILDESGYRGKIKIAYDEWNLRSWHHPGFPRMEVQNYADPEVQQLVKARELNDISAQYTMADALFTASFFNACLRHADDVGMANIAPIINTRGPLFVYSNGIVKRTHFHAMAMYANELQPCIGKVEVTADKLAQGKRAVPVLDALATVDESGKKWALALVNRHPDKSVACTIQFMNHLLDGKYSAVVLSGDSPEAFNSIENPNRVVPITKEVHVEQGKAELPAHSLMILKVDIRK